jgi:hypothetical protein
MTGPGGLPAAAQPGVRSDVAALHHPRADEEQAAMLVGASRRSPSSRSEITTVGFTDTREQVGDLGGDGPAGRR